MACVVLLLLLACSGVSTLSEQEVSATLAAGMSSMFSTHPDAFGVLALGSFLVPSFFSFWVHFYFLCVFSFGVFFLSL